MAKADKKIFLTPDGKEFTLVKGARWYLEYYEQYHGVAIRRRSYGGANRIKDPAARELAFYGLAVRLSAGSGGGHVLDEALAARRPLQRLKTWQSQKTRLKFYKAWLADRSPAIDEKDAAAFIAHLVAKGRQSATISSYRETLSALYQQAGLPNVWRAVEVPTVTSRSLMYFTPAQARAIIAHLQAVEPELAMACMLTYYCFIRPGELRLLTADCVSLEHGTITIPGGISKNKKTGTVVIPEPLLEPLAVAMRTGVLGEGFLFPSQANHGPAKRRKPGRVNTERPVNKNHFNTRHRVALHELKIKGRYAFYSWKHTGVVMAVKAGINLKDLQLQLRHHSLDMVNEYLKNLGVMDSADLRAKFPRL